MSKLGSIAYLAILTGGLSALPSHAADVDLKVRPFELDQVRLLDSSFKHAQELDHQYLLFLEPDRFLHTFRLTAGLPTSAQPYGGWETPATELRGHSLGHYLSGLSLMYQSTGDAKLKERIDYIVAELAKCQEALPGKGFNKGYLSAFPESLFDRNDARQRVWAPWYTMHKIMAGLFDASQLAGNKQAMDVLLKLADWVKFRTERIPAEQFQASLQNEFGGMGEVLANLYGVTHNPDHLKTAQAFDHKVIFDPLAAGEDKLNGLHANTQIPKFIGAAREYEVTGDTRYRDIANFSWQEVALKRSYVIGGHSDNEHFFPISDFAKHLSPVTAETCNTYNMLKLTRHLFAWEPSVEKMDFYERGLYNQILSSQDPHSGMMEYFIALKAGAFKVYNTPTDSFWCCTGTGMENHAKYGDTIYFHDDHSLYVNLFIPSELTWKDKGLTIKQETKFPEEEITRLSVQANQPTKLALRVRIPAWVQSDASISVNGQPVAGLIRSGSYATVDREWKEGDVVEINLPMALRTETLPGDPTNVAVLYGPVVLAGLLGTEGIKNAPMQASEQQNFTLVPTPPTPSLVASEPAQIIKMIEPVKGSPLTFKTNGLAKPSDVTLVPLYKVDYQRYGVYWKTYSPEEWKNRSDELLTDQKNRQAFEARIVDRVSPGNAQSETDHQFQGEQTSTGENFARMFREAKGYFSYQMKVQPDAPMALRVTYFSQEKTPCRFEVLVDGQKVAEQSLRNTSTRRFDEVEYAIPPELTRGKQTITVKFQPAQDSTVGGVYEILTVKAEAGK